VGSVSDVSEALVASIFMAEMSRVEMEYISETLATLPTRCEDTSRNNGNNNNKPP
jgi:hypothetical protein